MSALATVGFVMPEFGTRFVYPRVPRQKGRGGENLNNNK